MATMAIQGTAVGNESRTILATTRDLAWRRFSNLLDRQRVARQARIDASCDGRSSLEDDSLYSANDYARNRNFRNFSRDDAEQREVANFTLSLISNSDSSDFNAIRFR